MQNSKFTPMIGMFHDNGQSTKLFGNVAAGSERAGFSGPGSTCDLATSPVGISSSTFFDGNTAHSCLFGFVFDFYAVQVRDLPCVAMEDGVVVVALALEECRKELVREHRAIVHGDSNRRV